MAKAPSIESLLKSGSTEWNKLRKAGKVPLDHTGATFAQLFSANADLSGLGLVGSEWEKCDLSKMNFREADLSNSYFHGGRLQDCDFRGANLEGATFEKVKLLRCDFTGCQGLDELELDDVDMDRVVGLNGEEAPPPPPPPVHGLTHFTREQRTAAEAARAAAAELVELPPFRPQDNAGALLFRGLKRLGQPPLWVLDAPGLRPPAPSTLVSGPSLESQFREAVRVRLDGRAANPDADVVARAQKALRLSSKEAASAAVYLREVNQAPLFRFSAAKALKEQLKAEVEVDDLTASIDPKITGALLELRLPFETADHVGLARQRLAATQLFTSLLEAGFTPDHNWQEAIESQDAAQELAQQATGGITEELTEAFSAFAALPDEARLRRLAYLAEAVYHLDQLNRLAEGTEPSWLTEPEGRECHEREMLFIQALRAEDIPQKVAELAQTELGVPAGSVPEDSEEDLFLHFRCEVCGKEKLVTQSP